MNESKKDKQFIHKPYYAGGPKALAAFIRDNLRYPDPAAAQQIKGTVQLRYTINYLGKVVDVKVIKHLGFGCDEEAERLVRLLEFEVKRPHHLRIEFHKTINIHFRPPKRQKQPFQTTYNYKKKKKSTDKPASSSGYTYSITLNGNH